MQKAKLIIFFLLALILMQCSSEAPEKFVIKDQRYFTQIEKKADSYALTVLVSWDLIFEKVAFTEEEKTSIFTNELPMFMTIGQLDEHIKLTKLEQKHGFGEVVDEKILSFLASPEMMEVLNEKLQALIEQSGIDLGGHLVSCLIAVSEIEEKAQP